MSRSLKTIIPTVMLVGGGVIGYRIGQVASQSLSIYQSVASLILSQMFYLLHIVIHEAGHGLFGHLTGYKLVSYRVLSHLWVWQETGLVYRRQKVPGTLGQCLMRPPNYEQGYPFKLYLLGGILGNLGTSLIILVSFHSSVFAVLFAAIGFFVFLTNLIPLGFNDPGNYFVSFHFLLRYGYFLEAIELVEAKELLEALWDNLEAMIPIYQVELKKELLFCLAVIEPKDPRIEEIIADKVVSKSLKQPVMGNKRILASYHYFIKNDWQKGASLTQEGLELAEKSPLKGDATIEIKLITWLDEQAISYNNRGGLLF